MRPEWPDGQARPRRRPLGAPVELDENVALYDEAGQLLIMLNASAAAVWRSCDGATTLDDMVGALAAAHPGDAEVIGQDVRLTVRKLAELGLVAEEGESEAQGQERSGLPGP